MYTKNVIEANMSIDKLSYAVQLAKAGNKDKALPLLREIVRTDPDNEAAWLWLHACVDQTEQKVYCLQQALRINPYNQGAKRALEKLTLQDHQAHFYPVEEPEVQNMSGGKQKPPRQEIPAKPPKENQKKNPLLMGTLILLSLCVICCVGSWIYIKVSPPIPTRTPTSFPTLRPTFTPKPTLTPEPTLPPDLIITYDNVCIAPKNTEVTIRGYLYFRGSTELTDGEYKIALSKKPEEWDFDHPYEWEAKVFLFIKQGNDPNQMKELPKYRYITDLKVVTDTGKIVGHGALVEITGNVLIHYPAETGSGCGIRITKVVAK
jgi:tetratricopeptide (TPR) repeat protein